MKVHEAYIRPDVNPGMTGLPKEQPGSQLFTVFGQPDQAWTDRKDSEYMVIMEGVDMYHR